MNLKINNLAAVVETRHSLKILRMVVFANSLKTKPILAILNLELKVFGCADYVSESLG
jgi:hypothetical protein